MLRMRGITLIELMIVIVVLGIIVAVAYPSYRDFAARAKRNEARAALLQIATNQERFYLNNNTYTTDMTQLGFQSSPFTTETGSYTITVTVANANTYTARASYLLGGNEAGNCPTFLIDAAGAKTSPDGAHADCWTRTR
ncbi:MAG: type IV pilin protein [Pseudomonadota bacterium]